MHIAYVVPGPLQGALGQRVHSVSRAMVQGSTVSGVHLVAPECSLELDPDGPITFVATDSADQHAGGLAAKVRRRVNRAGEAVRALDGLRPVPDAVVVYGGGAAYMGSVARWARRRGVAVAADVVEWYDASHLPLGRWGPYALDNQLMMTRTLRRVDGAIVISRFLERHLRSLGVQHLVRVPPLADPVESLRDREDGPLRLAYCGSPGRKDRLDLVIRAIDTVDPEGERVRLDVAGIDADGLRALYGLDGLPRAVTVWGRVPHQRALELLSAADFVPLVRDDARFAHAGFPTKVVEALSLGVAPWLNLTSDLGDFLTDGADSVVIQGNDLTRTTESLRRLLELPRAEVAALAAGARRTAGRFTVSSAAPALAAWTAGLAPAHTTRGN